MKARTKMEIETVKVNSLLKEDISICDKKIVIKNIMSDENALKNGEYIYFTISENRRGFDISRLYRCYHFSSKKYGVTFVFAEISRTFTKDNKSTFFSKKRFCLSIAMPWDTFSFGSEINLVPSTPNTYGYSIRDLHGYSQIDIKRHSGKRVRCTNISPKGLNAILRIPYGETLYNAHEDRLIANLDNRTHINEFLASIRIAKKHGFVFNDENRILWFDMIESMIYIGADNHNPKFVAPSNLLEMHNYFLVKFQRKQMKNIRRRDELALIRKEKEALEAITKDKKDNESYIQRRRRFFDLDISNEKFDVHVLRDINEFFEEGKNMSHCVFSNKYYNKVDSLILSCRNKKGERVETIEVNLKEFKVVQCYGFKDNFTSHHKEILDLMKNNMNKIRMCFRGRYKSKQHYLQAI